MSSKTNIIALGFAFVAVSAIAASPLSPPPHTHTVRDVFKLDKIPTDKEVKSSDNIIVVPSRGVSKVSAHINAEEDVIHEVQGTRQDVTVTGSGYNVIFGMVFYYKDQPMASHVVYGENDEVYFFNILPNAVTDTYVKGVRDGDKITLTLPQTLLYDKSASEGEGDGYNLTVLDYKEMENGEGTYVEREGEQILTFSVDENGIMTTSDLGKTSALLGLVYCTGGWAGYGAYDLKIAPFDEVQVSIPEGYNLVPDYWSGISEDFGYTIGWAQGEEDVYFKGLFKTMPEAIVKGDINASGDDITIEIPQDQYMGVYQNLYMYTKCVKKTVDDKGRPIDEFMPADYKYELILDRDKNIIRSKDPDVYLVLNGDKNNVFSFDEIHDVSLFHQDSFAGTPTNPTDITYIYYDSSFSSLIFKIPNISVDGNVLYTDHLGYVIYINDEEWVFNAEDYLIDEDLTVIPWRLDSPYIWIYGGIAREVDFFIDGISTLGVQSVYNYNNVETRSEIVTINSDGSLVSVDTPVSNKEIAHVVYFDLTGRVVTNPEDGIYIKHTRYVDGTAVTAKEVIRR